MNGYLFAKEARGKANDLLASSVNNRMRVTVLNRGARNMCESVALDLM